MRHTRLLVALLVTGLLGLPALVVSAGTASAATLTSSVRITTTAKRLVHGQEVTYTGQLVVSNGTQSGFVPGERLRLQRRYKGTSDWKVIQERVTNNSTGSVQFTTPANRNASYRIRYNGGAIQQQALPPATSGKRTLKVERDIVERSRDLAGLKVRFFGKVKPKFAHKSVYLQRKTAGHSWTRVGKDVTNGKAKWSFVVRAGRKIGDVVRYRVFTKSGTKFVHTESRVLRVITTVARLSR